MYNSLLFELCVFIYLYKNNFIGASSCCFVGFSVRCIGGDGDDDDGVGGGVCICARNAVLHKYK